MILSSQFRQATAVALLSILVCSCSERSGNGNGRNAHGAAPVLVGRAQRKLVPLVIDAIGTVEPIRSATVRAQITGTLIKIDIREGQDVAEGDLLFEIDPRPFESALRSAIADQQKINVQLRNAKAQLERYSTLSVGAMVSKDQFEQVQDNARALEAEAAAADAAVASARLQLGYCSIRAPIVGRTGNLNVHEGDLIRANDAGALVTINQLSPIYVTFGLAQQHLPAIARYRQIGALQVAAAPNGDAEDRPTRGALTFVDNTVDAATGTIKLKATFANDDHRLWPGLFANVTMTLATPEVLTVPASAVQTDQTGQHVFVVTKDNRAEFRPVMVERTFDDDAVVTHGIEPGETVVTDGQLRVVPGDEVQIRPAEAPSNPEALQAEAKPAPDRRGRNRPKEGS